MSRAERWMVGLTLAVAIFTAVGGFAAWWGVVVGLRKDAAERKEQSEVEWEAVQVYWIINKATAADQKGLGLGEIAQQYTVEAQRTEDVHLEKKNLQDLELKKVVLTLLAQKLISQIGEDRYLTAQAILLPNAYQSFAVNRAVGAILAELASDGGKYTASELLPIVTEKAKISPEDYHIAINTLVAQGQVLLGEGDKLWSAAHPCPPNKPKKS